VIDVSRSWPAELVLVRHGQSTGNLADAHARSTHAEVVDVAERDADVPLSPLGRRQAQAVGHWLATADGAPAPPEVVVCSPYARAHDTARAVVDAARGAGHDVPDPSTDERLRERDLGWWDGLTGAGVRARFPEEAARRQRIGKFYYRPPGGESWADVAGRVRAVLEGRGPAGGHRLLIVSHQAVIMVMRYVLENLTEQQVLEIDRTEVIANTAVTTYAGADGALHLQGFNDASHLETSDAPVTEEPDAASVG
jgi:probable phosphoglycerate mutase